MKNGIEEGVKSISDDIDLRLISGSEDIDVSQQIRVMKSFLQAAEVDALILGPASSKDVVPMVAEYIRKNIPVIIVDSKLDSASLANENVKINLFIGSQNELGGQLVAEYIKSQIGEGEKDILLIEGSPIHETAISRQNGFKKSAPRTWNIIERIANWDRIEATSITKIIILDGVPDAIFAASDEMAMGVIAALKSSNVNQNNWPIIVGFDATNDGVNAIANGEMKKSIKQRPKDIGKQAVEVAWELINGKNVILGEKYVPVVLFPSE